MKATVSVVIAAVALLGAAGTAVAQERLGPLPPAQMTDLQKKVVEEFTKARPGGPFGFWWGYLRVPEVLLPFLEIQTHIHGVMETENGALGEKLTHFAMLIAARHWTQQVIWDLHDKNAIKAGLEPEILDDRMVAKFGERGVAEATLIQGEYTIMSMFMNVARTPLDPGTPPPLKPFPR